MVKLISLSRVEGEISATGAIRVDVSGAEVLIKHPEVDSPVVMDTTRFEVWDGVQIYFNPELKLLVTLPWGDRKHDEFVNVGTILNLGSEMLIAIWTSPSESIESELTVEFIPDFKEYICSFPSVKYRKSILKAKYDCLFSKIDPYSSIATLEAQVDLLTQILLDVVETNPELMAKHAATLRDLVSVGNFEGKPYFLESIIADKAMTRKYQRAFFERRAQVESEFNG